MLAELLEAVKDLSVAAEAPRVLPVDAHQRLIFNGSSWERVDYQPDSRRHAIMSLDSLVEMAVRFYETAAIWYCQDRVVVMFDDSTNQRQFGSYILNRSTQHRILKDLTANKVFDQRSLIFWLRTEFNRNGEKDLISIIRQLRWKSGDSGESTVSSGKASLGRKIEAEVTGEKSIPDEWIFSIPTWRCGTTGQHPIRVALEIDPTNQTFKLQTIAGEIDASILESVLQLGLEIRNMTETANINVPLYCGSPWHDGNPPATRLDA